ncbi:MAG: YfhO family protein [Rikenellaceae bacterium]
MNRIKKYIPHVVALLFFAITSAIYFAPQFEGKDVRQSDNVQYNGMKGGITEHIEEYGEHPQWAPNMFSGMPAYLIDMNYEGRYIKILADKLYFLGTPAAFYFVMMAGFYFMLLCFGVTPYLALLGGVAYGLSSYFMIIYEAGHITKLMALAYIAPLIGSVYLTFRKNIWLGASLTGIFAAIEISTSHPQITYYFFFVLLALAIFEGVNFYKQNRFPSFWARCGALIVVAALAFGANSVQLWYISNYTKDSMRGKSELKQEGSTSEQTKGLDKDYITAWSYGKMESLNLLVPNLMGESSSSGFAKDGEVAQSLKPYGAYSIATQIPSYWGPQPFTSGAVYVGAVIVFLFVFGLFIVKGWIKMWLASVSLLALFLAWGKYMMWFTDIFIDYVPLYSKFRTVSMILVIIQWSMPLLALLALQKVYSKEVTKEEVLKSLKRSLYIVGGILLILIIFGGSLFDFISDSDTRLGLPNDVISAMISERESMMKSDALRSLFFVLSTAAIVWAFAYEKIKKNVAISLLIVAVMIDMIGVDLRFLNHDHFIPKKEAIAIKPTSANLEILKDNDPNFRVANLATSMFNDAFTSYYHKSVGGYHAAKMQRYQDIIDKYLSKMNMDVYNMLNTKYFIVSGDNDELQVQLNNQAFGNAWFVDSILYTDNANDEIAALGQIDLRKSAVVDASEKHLLEGMSVSDSLSTIVLTDSKANSVAYRSNSATANAVIFSETYYKDGWTAYIDGEEVPYFRANYILRGLVVPSGEHVIEFKFAAPKFALMKGITVASSLVLLLTFAVSAILLSYKKYRSE